MPFEPLHRDHFRQSSHGICNNRCSVQCPKIYAALILNVDGHWHWAQLLSCEYQRCLIENMILLPQLQIFFSEPDQFLLFDSTVSFLRLKPVAFIRFAHLSRVEIVRSYSQMISFYGLKWLNSSTNCFFCSSLNVLLSRFWVIILSFFSLQKKPTVSSFLYSLV